MSAALQGPDRSPVAADDQSVTVRVLAPGDVDREGTDLLPALARVLKDCVDGGASVSFMAPFPLDEALAFWGRVLDDARRGERALLVAERAGGELVGTVHLSLAQPPNQPHRADVSKLLVRRDARRLGIGERLMRAVPDVARRHGKTVLVLDTVTGGDAERLYPRLGWQRVGEVPDYALMPDGRLCSTTYFHLPVPRG